MRTKCILPLLLVLFTGCRTYTLTVQHPTLPEPTDKREGSLALKLTDRREDKSKIGEMKGGFGNKVGDIVTKEELSATLAEVFKAALERAGYTVVANAPVTLEAEIREFLVFGNGWSQGAREKFRLLLRRSDGNVLWEHGVKGEDGGMVWMISSYEKSMNVALTRLLTEAMEEFTSELFYQSVKKENSKVP